MDRKDIDRIRFGIKKILKETDIKNTDNPTEAQLLDMQTKRVNAILAFIDDLEREVMDDDKRSVGIPVGTSVKHMRFF